MTSIISSYSINYLNGVSSRTKPQETPPVSKPLPPQPNVSFRGKDALAAYNYNLINKNKDFDNIPTIKPLEIPKNLEEINGEKIYNSKGELVLVQKETKNQKIL